MGLPVTTKNAALDGETVDHMGLHSAWPGIAGALGELSGGSPAYARRTVTLPAASGGQRVLTSPTTFDVPASTVRWVSLWNGSTFVIALPNGGSTPKNFMAIPASDLVWSAAHGWSDGQAIAFFNGTPPGGLTEGAIYFVRDSTADSFRVAATIGGIAIDLASASSFGCVVSSIVEDAYAAQSTHQINTATLAVPD